MRYIRNFSALFVYCAMCICVCPLYSVYSYKQRTPPPKCFLLCLCTTTYYILYILIITPTISCVYCAFCTRHALTPYYILCLRICICPIYSPMYSNTLHIVPVLPSAHYILCTTIYCVFALLLTQYIVYAFLRLLRPLSRPFALVVVCLYSAQRKTRTQRHPRACTHYSAVHTHTAV